MRLCRTGIWVLGAFLALCGPVHAASFHLLDDGVSVAVGSHELQLRACREDVIRVSYASVSEAGEGGGSRAFFARDTLMTVEGACQKTEWKVQAGNDSIALSTSRLTARVALPGGAVTFFDTEGRELLAERSGGGKTLVPALVQGEETFHVQAEFEPAEGEGLYGLGQHQNGWFDYSGRDVDLYQHNIVAVVPFLVSSRGYGLLWDNTSHTKFGDLRPAVHVPGENLYDASGATGGLTGTYRQGSCESGRVVATRRDPQIAFGAPEDRPAVSEIHNAVQATNADIHPALGPGDICITWEGGLVAGAAGEYDLRTFANNGVRVWLDGELVIDTFRQGWLPWWDSVRRDLAAGSRHPLRVEWFKEDGDTTLRLEWKTPPRSPYTSLWSEVGDGLDYYFVYGPDLDDVVAGYRKLTGRAPIMPRWALGLWQSRERYETAEESLDALAEFRRRKIPIDVMVQDWRYWKDGEWGSHAFDLERFPDPAGWIDRLHANHARLMLSVWPKFYRGTRNFEELLKRGYLYPETLKRPTTDWLGFVHTFYDAFNPGARQLFWQQVNEGLFSKGVDAWWMDATEPELVGEGTPGALKAAMNPTALGSGARMANAFALVSSEAIYEGQRSAAPDQRVFILTRSAFAGIQRYASATWSGDVAADWDNFRKQIPAGLNFSLSGVPWWTTDTGGFTVRRKWAAAEPEPEDLAEWRELNTRWWQFGTFNPLLRSHGQFPRREMWFFREPGSDSGGAAYETMLAFDRLRYRMLPYTYTLASRVSRNDETILRPLVMDFREDPNVRAIGDQFLFGPALLVNPVTHAGATEREVYLPSGAGWYDFWTGNYIAGGQRIEAPAPLESLPIYARAGSIVPMGPELQYTDEKPADPLTVWVYTGADAEFELYEDDGVSYGYERGAFSTLPFTWDETAGRLTIGERSGAFPGMLEEREIRVVLVSPERPIGHAATAADAIRVTYFGVAVTVAAPRLNKP
jgi:alpha-D-xyloside xylohydrolase